MTTDFVVLLATHEKVISVDGYPYDVAWAKESPIAYVLYWLYHFNYEIKEFQVTNASYGVDGTHYNYEFYILSRVRE
ncbi:MAG: hypothetical protein N4A62_13030 [Marinisporobacter sp.]|nr:hypothetical protein [Marinisporobacter sp.]